MKITIETEIRAPLETVWHAWITPDDIINWNFASEDWCCPSARIDLDVGGGFSYRMEARDGSMGFDFEGTFTAITPLQEIRFTLDDKREVSVVFSETGNGVKVIESFEAEDEHSAEQQRQGWQSILDNFRRHVEGK